MNDLISRQAAIDAMSESLKRVFPEHRQIAEKCLNALPSAQPEPCEDAVSRLDAISHFRGIADATSPKEKYNEGFVDGLEFCIAHLSTMPPAQPEQLEQCPIYGGMCAYPSDQCYDCPRHAGAKMGVTS